MNYFKLNCNQCYYKYNILSVIIDMDAQWFDALFDGDYNSVMNHVVDYVSYGESGSNNGGDGDGDGDGDGSTNIDDDDDGDGGGEENDSDDEGESFGMREFDRRKLVLCTTRALALYYNNYIYIRNHVWFCTIQECDG
jgi:hypothetical protein